MAEPLNVVCLMVGDALSDAYVVRLQSMIDRNLEQPFRLTCLTDRTRDLPAAIDQIDISSWNMKREGMRPTTLKLGLFEQGSVPFHEFLYLDLTLVVVGDLTPLTNFARTSSAALIINKDWTYESYNSSVMWIRHGRGLDVISRAFREGKSYPSQNMGDQDFIYGACQELGLTREVEYWPEGMVLSYKVMRDVAMKSGRDKAAAMLQNAAILKFHGRPRMSQLLDKNYRTKRTLKNPLSWFNGYYSYLAPEVQEWWR